MTKEYENYDWERIFRGLNEGESLSYNGTFESIEKDRTRIFIRGNLEVRIADSR